MDDREPLCAARLAGYGTVATQLSLLSDHQLQEVVASAVPLGSGIGGRDRTGGGGRRAGPSPRNGPLPHPSSRLVTPKVRSCSAGGTGPVYIRTVCDCGVRPREVTRV